MSVAKQSHQRHEFWEQHVRSYHGIGLSKADYCREHGLVYHQFFYWQAKISGISIETTAGGDNIHANIGHFSKEEQQVVAVAVQVEV